MGELIDEDDCEVCVPFDQEWIFTYGDLVTLLLCFFILLFSTCTYETMKFKSLAASFKPLPAGTPHMNEGKDSIVEQIAQQLEESELGDDANINVEEKGVVVSFKASAYFKTDSAKLNAKAVKEMTRFSKLIFLLPNKIQIEGHTEKFSLKIGIQPGNWLEHVPRRLLDSLSKTVWIPQKLQLRVLVQHVRAFAKLRLLKKA